MPICHGSGGLAGQYRFGARSGASIIILGLVKFALGLFVGNGIVPLMQRLPKSLLGIMVLAAGVELAKVGQTVNEGGDLWDQADEGNADGQLAGKPQKNTEQRNRDRWMVMLITVAGCLAFKNDAVGFVAGLAWHWGLKSPEWYQRLRHGSIKLRRDDHSHQGEGLLSLRPED
jgi:xanthine/uracil permease